MPRKLNAYEIRMMHIIKSKMGWDDDTYHDILQNRYQKKSSLQMDISEYNDYVKMARAAGFKEDPRIRQHRYIKKLCKEHNCDNKRLAGIVKYVCKVDASASNPLKWLDSKQLSIVIQALRRWKWEVPYKVKVEEKL